MADYVNPTGHIEAAASDDSFVFNVPLVGHTTADANGGTDSLLFDVDSANGVTVRAMAWNGVLQGTVQTGPYDPSLNFYEFEAFEFVGTEHAEWFELRLMEGYEGLVVDADAGAGNDLLTYDFSAASVGQSFIVSGGTITSSYAQFAGFERFEITGGSGSDTIQTGAGNDMVTSHGGPNPSSNPDTVSTGGGDDTIQANTPGSYDGGAGTDRWTGNFTDEPWAPNTTAMTVDLGSTITISNGTTATNVESVTVGTASGDDTFNVTRGGYVQIYAGAGTDTLNVAMGLAQAQTFLVYTTNAGTLLGTANELGFSEVEEVAFTGGTFDDNFRVLGLFTADQIAFHGGGGSDLLQGEFNLLSGATSFVVNPGGTITSNRGTFTSFERFVLFGGSSADTFVTRGANDFLAGGGGDDSLSAGAGNDWLSGEDGNDMLNGGDGDDYLYGDAGADAMSGGSGDDTYRVDQAGDTVIEGSGQGADTVEASASHSLGANVENLTLTGFDAISGTGNALANRLIGNLGANVLSGGDGADTLYGDAEPYGGSNDWLIGGAGDDVFYVVQGDTVTEHAGGGFDRVISKYDYTLGAGAEIEVLQLEDPAEFWAQSLSGNAFAQTLIGNAGANVLDGRGGADIMSGLGGDDWYYVDNAHDGVSEGAGGGTGDRVLASVSYALGAGVQVERLTTHSNAGTAAINLAGNELANLIYGNAGANVLDGRGGADTLVGLGGDDRYYVDNAADAVSETAGNGTDRVLASVSYTLGAGVHAELLSTNNNAGAAAIDLTGNELSNTIYGNAGANTLDGRGGNDTLVGLAGTDTFSFTTTPGAGNVDIVSGFVVADDTIRLENAVFTGLAAGALAAGAFNTGAAASQADDRVIYNSATGALLFDADGAGGAAAVQFASLTAGLAMTSADFLVI